MYADGVSALRERGTSLRIAAVSLCLYLIKEDTVLRERAR